MLRLPQASLSSDSLAVESPLEKLLRLTGGVTRTYVRNENGRPVVVHQYVTPHRAAVKPVTPRPDPLAAPSAARAATRGSMAFSKLQRGQVVQIANQRYQVVRANTGAPSPGSGHHGVGGSGLTTGSGGPISHGRVTSHQGGPGLHTAPNNPAVAQPQDRNPADLALGGRPIPHGTPTITSLLASMSSGRHWYVTLPSDFVVRVVS